MIIVIPNKEKEEPKFIDDSKATGQISISWDLHS